MHLSDIDVPPARAEQAAEQAAAGGRVGASVCITTHQTFFAVVKTSILSGTSPTAPAAHGSAAIGGQAACRLGQRRTQIAPAPAAWPRGSPGSSRPQAQWPARGESDT